MESDIRARRARNLCRLIGSEPGAKEAAARRIGVSASYLSQMLNPDSTSGSSRPVSEKRAREIETAFGKSAGWLSMDHDAPPSVSGPGASPAMLAIIETMQEQHAMMESLMRSVSLLSAAVEGTQGIFQLVITALWQRDPDLRPIIAETMQRVQAQAEELGASAISAQAQVLLDLVSKEPSNSPEDEMRETMERLTRNRGTGA